MHLKEMPVIESEHPSYQEDWLHGATAAGIMQPRPESSEIEERPLPPLGEAGSSGEAPGVVCFRPHAQVGAVVDVLCAHRFHGFPVVTASGAGERSLVGIVLREQIVALLRNKVLLPNPSASSLAL